MQDDVVADRAVLADRERKAAVGMAGRIVLHIGAFADLDPLIVAAQHRAEPDAGLLQKPHLADDIGGLRNEVITACRKVWSLAVEFVDRHSKKVSIHGDLGMAAGAGSSEARWPQASTPAARSVIRKNVPDIRLQKPAST